MIARTLKPVFVAGLVIAVVFIAKIDFQTLSGVKIVPISEQQVEIMQERAKVMKQLVESERLGD